jgi:uncharacterized membrane protein
LKEGFKIVFGEKSLLYLMAFLYVVAGINHFWHPHTYLKIIPPLLPWHEELNFITGVLEIIFGILLLLHITRNIEAWGLVALLVLIFPANIQMAINYSKEEHPDLWLAYLRLPLQFFLMWWALVYTDWYRSIKGKGSLNKK